ncbi:spore germination protein [Bacillus suaedaesalsae]|uniref:Spore germination protein n=1 Tax=Bacillus suaedaesalsae TaxID=2810349 RepID=A0ABS2DLU6_9BACI|nr:spore germination protein [Bacillus suaedaesalsae]MBM6619461.1 spore germination protein [Bacillus suaedaesalsae]
MPSFVGSVNIDSVGNGVFTVGDALRISPNGGSQDNGGAGSFNSGDFIIITDKKNHTNVNDPDISDEFSLSIKPFIK